MASAGDVLENPVTGQRLIVRRTAAETGGEVLEVESIYTMPTPFPPTAHYHPYQEERFKVLAVSARARPLPFRRAPRTPCGPSRAESASTGRPAQR